MTIKLKNTTTSIKQCHNTCWFKQIFIFFQNYQNQGQSTEGKEKSKDERNDDKKKNQIRIFLYPIYKI